jgi:polyhydroxybutyrate depolymerase
MISRSVFGLFCLAFISLSVSSLTASAQSTCNPALAAVIPGDSTQTIESGGLTRSYRLHIPESYDLSVPTPLVLSLHGFTSNSAQQAFFSGWDEIANAENFIVAYPQGAQTPSRWNAGPNMFTRLNPVDDVAFIRALIAQITENYCIDTARIFVNGLSNGGGMTHRLACEMADQIAAVGMVAGAFPASGAACEPARPVPVIAFHGTDDGLVPYDGNRAFPPIQDWAAEWAARNGCDPTPEIIPAAGDTSGVHYINCDDNADVILYTIDGGGHTWPGGPRLPILGKTSRDINASEVMWEFFMAHPLGG